MAEQKVIVGRIVHFVQDDLECAPGIVNRVYPAEPGTTAEALGQVSVAIFPWADGVESYTAFECQEKPIPQTWHWPEGCTR